MHIGIRSEEFLSFAEQISAKLSVPVKSVGASGVGVGVNLIPTWFTINHIEKLMDLLLECRFKRFIFLRYKPIADRVILIPN